MTPLWDWDTAVADWTTAMQAAGRSPRTIRLYTCHLRKVIRECPDGPASVTSTDLRYVLSAGSWKPETRKSVRGSVTAFFRWAHGAGFIPVDPAQGLAAVRVPAGVARPVPDDVLHDALARADERDRTMILLGAYAGLRCMEIARVHSRDWDGTGLYVTGKGGKTRYVPVIRMDLRRALPWVSIPRARWRASLGWVRIEAARSGAPCWLDRAHPPAPLWHRHVCRYS